MANLAYIQIIRRCNQTCRFCSNPENGRELPTPDVLRLLDEYAAQGCDGVILTGGEPTLHEGLVEIIAHAARIGLACRIITNGQKTADPVYLETLLDAGLSHIHLSIHSHRAPVQARLTGNRVSSANLVRTLFHLRDRGVAVDVNQTICAQNADHVHETVRRLCRDFPYLKHFSWTYLDPYFNRVAENPDVVPRLSDSEHSLLDAMRFLTETGRSFRIEKVPLCFMGEFAHFSTETRAMVKGEGRRIAFLDDRGDYSEVTWRYAKGAACAACTLDGICAGLWDGGGAYSFDELRTMTTDPAEVVRKVRNGG